MRCLDPPPSPQGFIVRCPSILKPATWASTNAFAEYKSYMRRISTVKTQDRKIEFSEMMHFLLRSSQASAADQPPVIPETYIESSITSKPITTLEGLLTEDMSSSYYTSEVPDGEITGVGSDNGCMTTSRVKDWTSIADKHVDVVEDEGWITIPCRELPSNWNDAPDIHWFCSLDRSFVFAGERVHILACLSASKQDTEIITPFKVAALMLKNGGGQSDKNQNGTVAEDKSISETGQTIPDDHIDHVSENSMRRKSDSQTDVSASESLLRLEDYRRQTQTLMQKFQNSHFFARIVEFGEPLWSKRSGSDISETVTAVSTADGAGNDNTATTATSINALIDKGRFDAKVCGGVARNSVKCCSLTNGDIVVLLEVNVGVNFLKDPMLEILQFEKYEDMLSTPQKEHTSVSAEHDPCGELLKWLLPLDNSFPPLNCPFSPPLASLSHKASFSTTSGSQIFSFGHFRSHSMSSLSSVPPNSTPQPVPSTSSKPNFDLGDWDGFASKKSVKSQKTGSEGLLSFRGAPLEPERFSVCCGLEGIYIPGRRWRRRLEIIQPVDIHTFAADCNTEDLLCVQIKNVSPAHFPDIIVYIDAVIVIFEEASKGGPTLTIPIACIEAGTDYSLPNLALRRGEEHSFILKPAASMLNPKMHGYRNSQSLHSKTGSRPASLRLPPKSLEGKNIVSSCDQYAVLVSCRCNYSESKLFFKKSTSWRPHISRDLMISVASEMSKQALEHEGEVSQLPVQVLTLQASNLTSEDLTLTILAPASFTSLPSVVSLSSSPSSPSSPFVSFLTTQRLSSTPLLVENPKQNDSVGARSVCFDEQTVSVSDSIPAAALSCNHLWLQSRIPLGCVPSQSTATVKLELLPLTDGIIILDTLQINVKEKGLTYIPEYSLKINATSSISTGII
ncbi:hypothetical protein Nepgr_013954 [Nepenthes gracilis]|uniref:Uncharacterized protein n=1 Tax=Nepenthes gracilis TaxID=150966 RepID=A0AAD3SJ23_NEPGR|nr:hypothetical protein Nepgr_013954 [Nepenthes gracilis]